MSNPYEPPAQPGAMAQVDRTKFVVAGVCALLAAGYWGIVTLLITFGAAHGESISIARVIIPCYLIAVYAMRGIQIIQGDVAAARRIVLLHIVGAVAALIYAASGVGFLAILQGAKVLINGVGAFTAWRASR